MLVQSTADIVGDTDVLTPFVVTNYVNLKARIHGNVDFQSNQRQRKRTSVSGGPFIEIGCGDRI